MERKEIDRIIMFSLGRSLRAKARIDLAALRGAEAPLFHGAARIR
jgi:hypothetical protein